LINCSVLTKNSRANDVFIIYFETNKNSYYNDEDILINASWELNYNPFNEISYIQIQIFDIYDHLLWNSSKYSEIGIFEMSWVVTIGYLNISFSNYSNTLFVKFRWFWTIGENGGDSHIKSIEIETVKRDVLCELKGFKNEILYGDDLDFTARFFSMSNGNNLTTQLISFSLILNDLILYSDNYTTNSSGMIKIFIPFNENLILGDYVLIFKVIGNKFYNSSKFEYNLYINLENHNDSFNKNIKSNADFYFLDFFFFISILSFISISSLMVYFRFFKKSKMICLKDVVFKY
jgi:hypothetical protein